jgi:multidrug efflux system membrane fusion protein
MIDVLHDAFLAPAEAIQRGPQGAFVYVVSPEKVAQLKRVQVGPAEAGIVSIKTGVAAGDALVVDGAEKVQDGAKVEPRQRQAGAPGGAAGGGAPGGGGPGAGGPGGGGPGGPGPGGVAPQGGGPPPEKGARPPGAKPAS